MKATHKWKESINEKIFFMNITQDKHGDGVYSAKDSFKPVNFYCPAPGAKEVHLAGGFNHGKPS